MAIAGDHLRRTRVRLESQPFAGDALDFGIDLRVGPDRSRQLSHAIRLERVRDALACAVEFERPTGELPAECRGFCVDAVRTADADGVTVLLRSCDDRGECLVDACEDQATGILNLQRERRVDDVGRREPIVEPASLGPQLLCDGIHERSGVVVDDAFDLGDTLSCRRSRVRANLRDVFAGDCAHLRPAFERSDLDLQPPRELALLRPDPGHRRAGVAPNHLADSREPIGPRIRAASTAAFFALSTPTQATGTPGGIWAIESSASSPSSTLSEDRSGTPITGRSVWAASTPGSAAASPAPAMSTRKPRPRAVRPYSATASGCRCAERTSNSCAMPRASSSSIAACMRGRSDSEPTTIPTSGLDMDHRCDVAPVPHAREGDVLAGRVRPLACLRDCGPGR